MHADVSRVTFQPEKQFTAVVAQQGRVQLDAEANEQSAIGRRHDRTLATDVIGPHAGPVGNVGLELAYQTPSGDPADLTIIGGRYYVDGLPVDATQPAPPRVVGAEGGAVTEPWTYWTQPHGYLDPDVNGDRLPNPPFLAYLRVWERFVSGVEDPQLRETALGASLPDTAGRLKLVWQVLPIRDQDGFQPPADANAANLRTEFDKWSSNLRAPASWLAARTEQPPDTDADPCVIPPDARFRGPENQLYRVEVRTPGTAGTATFTWSRDNGSVIFPVNAVQGRWITLGALGRDDKLDLHVGDWVALDDDASVERGRAVKLLPVVDVDLPGRRVQLSEEPGPAMGRLPQRHPFLRRWDQAPQPGGTADDGALHLTEGAWIDLEDGVQVWFAPGGRYRTGDYWVLAARTLTGTVEWPQDDSGRPVLLPPAGPEYHYAPLAWITGPDQALDLREVFRPAGVPIEQTQAT
jgi:Family of unknown function (DUF6519)